MVSELVLFLAVLIPEFSAASSECHISCEQLLFIVNFELGAFSDKWRITEIISVFLNFGI